MRKVVVALIFMTLGSQVWAEPGKIKMSLGEALKIAFVSSPLIKGQLLSVVSAKEQAESVGSRMYPSLGIEGSYRQVSEVGVIDLPMGNRVELGDKKNYSIGPVLKWIVWDSGKIKNNFESLKAIEKSQVEELAISQRQLAMQTRLAYFKVQYALEQQLLITDSLKLAMTQYKDIQKRKTAGAASQLDVLSAHQEVINLKKTFSQIQIELTQCLRELYSLLGANQGFDASFPLNIKISNNSEILESNPTVFLDFETLDKVSFGYDEVMDLDEVLKTNPSVKSVEQKIIAAKSLSDSLKAEHWPQLLFQAKVTRDYPNTPNKNEFTQNTMMLTLNIPVWEWGRVTHEVQSQNAKVSAIEEQRRQILLSLEKEYNQANEQIKNLKEQKRLSEVAVKETGEIARLMYQDYLSGRVNFTEVLRANLLQLSAKVQHAQTTVQLLVQCAKVASLNKTEEF